VKASHLILPTAGSSLTFPAFSQEVTVYVAAMGGARLASKSPLHCVRKSTRPESVSRVYDTTTYQKIDGFGPSFLEAGPISLENLDVSAQEASLRAVFDALQGVGFSAMKTVVGATDCKSVSSCYTYEDDPGDRKLLNFSIAGDLEPTGSIPYIKRARQHGNFVLKSPMNYPSDGMLFDMPMNQSVNLRSFLALTRHYLCNLRANERNGILIDFLSPSNGPVSYTKIPADKIRDLVRDYAGPLIAKEDVGTRMQVCDSGKRGAPKGAPINLCGPLARKHVGAISYCGYGFKEYGKIETLRRRYLDLAIRITEADNSGASNNTSRSQPLRHYDHEDGDVWGSQILSDLELGACTWNYWRIILDQRRGPYLLPKSHGDYPDNLLHLVAFISRRTKHVVYPGLYYHLAYFSKSVGCGIYGVWTEGGVGGLWCMAFQSSAVGLAAELSNSQTRQINTELRWRGKPYR